MFVFLIFKLALSFGLPIMDIFEESDYDSNDDKGESVPIEPNTNIGNCSCDTSNQCEMYCCCDPDCPLLLISKWKNEYPEKCLSEYSNIKTSEYKALRKCKDPQIEGDGSLLDWIQRTMLCIYKDNFIKNDIENLKHGKYYEIKAKSSEEYIRDQSSLEKSFQVKNDIDSGFPSSFSLNNLYEIGTDKPFMVALFSYCDFTVKDVDPDTIDYCYHKNGLDYTNIAECEGYYVPKECNETYCRCENPNISINYYYQVLCPANYSSNGTFCILNYSICDKNYKYQKLEKLDKIHFLDNIINETYKCDNTGSEYGGEEGSGDYYRNVTISNISCIESKCYANFTATVPTKKEGSNTGQSSLLEDDDAQENEVNVTLYIKFEWQKNEDAKNVPRGYFFGDPIFDKYGNPITINAPTKGNSCSSEDKGIPLKFGMNTDFSCMIDQTVESCNISDNFTSCIEKLKDLINISRNVSFCHVPYPYDDNETDFGTLNFSGDFDEIINNVSIIENGNLSEIKNLYLNKVTRSIDIFYKTVGYEHSPTHILDSMKISYDYSTSINKYLDAPNSPVGDYQKVVLRTIIKYYEYPNNLNMFRGSSANTKLQSWLPFDV